MAAWDGSGPARAAIVACVVVMALLTWVGSAAAATSWRSLHTSGQLNISDLVGTARGGDGTLHVAWQRRTSNGLYDLMQTPVTAMGAVRAPMPIVTGRASVEGPTLLASGSALFAFFSGTQTLVTGDPHEGIDYAITGDGGATWALAPTPTAAGDFAGQRDAGVALGPDGAARIVPGSTYRVGGAAEAFCPASTRVPLVGRQSKGFFVATVDGKRRTVNGWVVGAPQPDVLAGGSSYKQYVAASGKHPSFRVLDAGDPVKDATVTLAGQSDTTGADGRVTITVDRPGRYIARATAPKYVDTQTRVTVRRR